MESEVGMEQLVQALPLEERVPILALKHYYDQRSQLDQEQEMQLELARRKYDDRVKPLLERVLISSFRLLNSFREVFPNRKKSLYFNNM